MVGFLVGSDHAGDILREEDTFNRYNNPEVRPVYCDQHSISVHDSSCAGAPWVELTKEHDIKWEPSWQDKYTGPQGGPPAGPTQFIIDIVRSAKGLADIFFAIIPLAFFERVAQLTTKYCYDDWVVKRRKKYSDGNNMKQFYYVQV